MSNSQTVKSDELQKILKLKIKLNTSSSVADPDPNLIDPLDSDPPYHQWNGWEGTIICNYLKK